MPPVPIYSQSPINAAKPSGVTPRTDTPDESRASGPPAISTPAAPPAGPGVSSPPPAAPGAAPSLPRPTGTVQSSSSSSRYAPTPTRTTAEGGGPPPPQPGAVPVPPRTHPPRTGEAAAAAGAGIYASHVTTLPPQMAIPSLGSASYQHPVPRGTATSIAPASQGTWPSLPVLGPGPGLGLGPGMAEERRSLEHPPGYVQNPYAADMSTAQRETAGEGWGGRRRGSYSAGSGLGYAGGTDGREGDVWDAAKKFAKAAGERLLAAESNVWRRIIKDE